MSLLTSEHSTNLGTRFFLPQWWIGAYETLISLPEDNTRFSKIPAFGLAPQMNVLELNALAQILTNIQSSVLKNNKLNFDLNLDDLSWDFVAGPKARIESFESVVSKLGGMRLIRPSQNNTFQYDQFFCDESWKIGQGQNLLSLEIPNFHEDKIFGYLDPYFLWTQAQRSTPQEYFKSKFQSHSPISLWKSIWLDLTGAEQALLLRLEKKMQWNEDWLHIEGVFEVNLDQAFAGLKLPVVKDSAPIFAKKLHVLKKLGRKLVEHGFLSSSIMPDFLIFNKYEQGRGINFTWQVASERLFVEDSWQYMLQVCRYYLTNALGKHRKKFIAWLGAGIVMDEYSTPMNHYINQLEAYIQNNGIKIKHLILSKNGNLTSLIHLFIEWYMRQLPGHHFPLPSEIADSYAAQLASPYSNSESSFIQNFESFVTEISENPSYYEVLEQLPLATLVSESSFLNEKVLAWSRGSAEKILKFGIDSDFMDSRPQLIYSKEIIDPDNLESSKLVKNEVKEEVISQNQHSLSANTNHLDAATANRYAKNQMKKIAAEELKNIQRLSPDSYLKLKNAFLESLAPDQRRIFDGVKNKMAHSAFELLLKNKIMDFMVENPSAWTSIQTNPKNSIKHN